MKDEQVSTGLPALDRILQGIRPGDNVVWQVDSRDDYVPFIEPLIKTPRMKDQGLSIFILPSTRNLFEKIQDRKYIDFAPKQDLKFSLAKFMKSSNEMAQEDTMFLTLCQNWLKKVTANACSETFSDLHIHTFESFRR